MLLALEPESMPELLGLLDRVEGVQGGLFSRQLRNVDGTLAWVYVAHSCAGLGTAVEEWR